ncbi:50S ribosomal protein L11 methyltransferase [Pseudanabaena sp. FACHB-1277]|jgi:ribosomal protein L11 methyltransferase|uniref:Ribosomal protein L11 methyltransferase n=1 Tax=Pseudanabaena cinerea FACHB-1277 TaxID=2949581 RepID=A0A926UQA7_9CYAN|nr:50S ribosomal protein L11 methyltransferase [Pseudanabaena cinerea]MBD2149114.1 50S ribosomal protein L11 methyltransferase [Pseudanabaena cinerea FACHB-1277]
MSFPMLTSINNWWEIQVVADSPLEEQIFWRLQNFGCQGMVTQSKDGQILVQSYLPIEKGTVLDLAALALWLKQDAIAFNYEPPVTKWVVISDEDWSSSWKQHWHPQKIGDMFVIYPAWIEPETTDGDRKILRLDPGSAFGTGAHATTQLCLEALEMRLWGAKPEDNIVVADVGCGSGILSIGALLIGASQTYAIDNDILAIKATNHNRQLNGIAADKIWVQEGSIEDLIANMPVAANGFTCNILADVIVEMVPYFDQLVDANGWGILSGILTEQVPKVADALDAHKWVIATFWKRQEWACLTIRRSEY